MELNRVLSQVLGFSNGEMMSDYWILRYFKFWTKPFSFKEALPSCGPLVSFSMKPILDGFELDPEIPGLFLGEIHRKSMVLTPIYICLINLYVI